MDEPGVIKRPTGSHLPVQGHAFDGQARARVAIWAGWDFDTMTHEICREAFISLLSSSSGPYNESIRNQAIKIFGKNLSGERTSETYSTILRGTFRESDKNFSEGETNDL
jgi:hypothetical protein